jgi:hypothetical protein
MLRNRILSGSPGLVNPSAMFALPAPTSKELGKGEQGIRREHWRLESVCSPE